MTKETKKHADPARAMARRQQVLSAAEICFARKGFHGASMAEISQTAEMSAGHIYNYFESKESIIAAIAEQRIESFFAQDDDTIESHVQRHILESQQDCNTAMMFDILAEAVRNPKMAEIVHAFDAKAQKKLEAICARRSKLPPAELSEKVETLRMFLMGFRSHKVCNPKFSQEKMSRIIKGVIKSLFPEDFK